MVGSELGPVDPFNSTLSLTRLSRSGGVVWTRDIVTAPVTLRDLDVTSEGEIVAIGEYWGATDLGSGPLPTGPGLSLWIARFDTEGRLRWARGFPQSCSPELTLAPNVYAHGVTADSNGEVVVTGSFSCVLDFGDRSHLATLRAFDTGPHRLSLFLVKLSPDGEPLWSVGGPALPSDPYVGRDVLLDPAGNVYVSGRSRSGGWFIAGFDSAGTVLLGRLHAPLELDGRRFEPRIEGIADLLVVRIPSPFDPATR